MALSNVAYRTLRKTSELWARRTVWVGKVESLVTPWSANALASARLLDVSIIVRKELVAAVDGGENGNTSSLPAYEFDEAGGKLHDPGRPGGTEVSGLNP